VDQRSFVLTGQAAQISQIQVFLFDGTNETPVGATVNVGTASPGDTVEVRFRVRNIGTGPVALNTLSLAGAGFSISSAPSLPYTLAPYTGSPVSEVEFDVAFSPTSVASYSASLLVNTINLNLQGTGALLAVLTQAGSTTPLVSGATIDFGSVAAGNTKSLTFNLSNPGNTALTVNALSVTGTGFQGPIGATAPISLAPGQTVSFQISFQPTSGQASKGTLAVDQRSFVLTGQGLNPPLPAASIVLGATVGTSGQQNNITISLAAASQVSATGTLTMAFQSSVKGVSDDPTIQFLSGPPRQATVSVSPGATTATFDGNQSELQFQTGATAGTITFTLTLGNGAPQQATLPIPPAAINIDTATCVRQVGALNFGITAIDNTYSASQLTFTFYDAKGGIIQPGAIQVNAASDFQQYFATTQTGGTFALLATFPVTGNTSQIITTTVAITNSVGVTTTQRITIGN
jgi:hypothetical protein